MADFEVVVRPVIFPDIRPRPRQSLPPLDNPEEGFAVIRGNPARSLPSSITQSISSSHVRPSETQRRVDEARIYQEEDDGTINKDNFIDVQVANKIWMNEAEDSKEHFYNRVKETENIEILKKDKIIKKDKE